MCCDSPKFKIDKVHIKALRAVHGDSIPLFWIYSLLIVRLYMFYIKYIAILANTLFVRVTASSTTYKNRNVQYTVYYLFGKLNVE